MEDFPPKIHQPRIANTAPTLARSAAAILSAALVLAACGGGGGSGGGNNNPPPPPDPDPLPPVTYSISGTVAPAAAIDYDSDVNDPNAIYADNYETPQVLENIVTLHGFASNVGTSSVGLDGRFANSADQYDVFQAHLQAGQQIQLHIIDYVGFNLASAGDLDLSLFDSNGDLITVSNGTTEFELIEVPATGDYYIQVDAYEGISKYVLRLMAQGEGAAYVRSQSVDFVPAEMVVQFDRNNSVQSARKIASTQQLRLSHNDNSRPALARFASTSSAISKGAAAARSSGPGSDLGREKYQTLQRIKAARQQAGVRFAEPNYYRHAAAVPNDELYSYQWHYPQIQLPQAWDITTGSTAGDPVIVAVIDTGVYLSHPDMQGQLVGGYDFISANTISLDGNGIDNNPDDPGDSQVRGQSSFHGTHVAGTIAARTNDGQGAAGVSWGARIMPIRVLGQGGGTSYDISQGIRYAAGLANDSGTLPARRADIINMSLGGSAYTQSEQDLLNAVRDAGVIVVAAAGNENTDTLSYPASYDGVISVSAIDFNGARAPYSNFGSRIDVAAPGGDVSADINTDGYADGVLSAAADDTSGSRQPAFRFYNGTSMASPHIAGVIALMKAVYPALTPANVDALLQTGAITDEAGATGRDNTYGYGIINAYKAVRAAQQLADGGNNPVPEPSIVATPSSITFGLTAEVNVDISNQGGGSPTVTAVASNAAWLTIAATSVDAGNFGEYRLSVNRSALGDGYYQASISVEVDGAAALTIPVTMQVGAAAAGGRSATQYVLLTDPQTLESVAQVQATDNGNGTLGFQFSDIAPGAYAVISGSDVDNNGAVCESGESCGAYPSIGEFSAVTVQDRDISGISITVNILDSISTAAAQQSGVLSKKGVARLPSQLPKQVQSLATPIKQVAQ